MSLNILDPIDYSEASQQAGMPKKQADLIAKTQEARIGKIVDARNVATKTDLLELELRLSLKMANNKAELIRWVVGSAFAVGGLLLAALAYMRPPMP